MACRTAPQKNGKNPRRQGCLVQAQESRELPHPVRSKLTRISGHGEFQSCLLHFGWRLSVHVRGCRVTIRTIADSHLGHFGMQKLPMSILQHGRGGLGLLDKLIVLDTDRVALVKSHTPQKKCSRALLRCSRTPLSSRPVRVKS